MALCSKILGLVEWFKKNTSSLWVCDQILWENEHVLNKWAAASSGDLQKEHNVQLKVTSAINLFFAIK